jgi:hypothetical protein
MKSKSAKTKGSRPVSAPSKVSWTHSIDDQHLTKLLEAHAKANPASAPSGTTKTRPKRIRDFIFMRPLCDPPNCPGWPNPDDPPKDPCAGQTWVWQPDIAVEFKTFDSQCPSEATLKLIEQGLGGNLVRFQLPDPEVRVTCSNATIYIHIWGNKVLSKSCAEKARDRAQVPELAADANFGVYINASLIRRLANSAFQDAPKTLADNGIPDPNGPLHLTSLTVSFQPPNSILTHITGYDDRPWPDVNFTTTLADHLSTLQQSTPDSNTDFSYAVQVITLLDLAIISYAIPQLIPVTAFVLFSDLNAAFNQPATSNSSGVGARLLQALPAEIPLPQSGGVVPPKPILNPNVTARLPPPGVVLTPHRQKLVIAYGQPAVDDSGLYASGFVSLDDRSPSAHLSGPTSLSVYATAEKTFGIFTVAVHDFFGKVTFVWTSGPDVVVESPGQQNTKIFFRRGNAQPGSSFTRTVRIRATDQEGTSITASLDVSIYVDESGDLPPLCRIKPWLPQCQPPGGD